MADDGCCCSCSIFSCFSCFRKDPHPVSGEVVVPSPTNVSQATPPAVVSSSESTSCSGIPTQLPSTPTAVVSSSESASCSGIPTQLPSTPPAVVSSSESASCSGIPTQDEPRSHSAHPFPSSFRPYAQPDDSSTSSSDRFQTLSDVIKNIVQLDGKDELYLNDLVNHMPELFKFIKNKSSQTKPAPLRLPAFSDALTKLKDLIDNARETVKDIIPDDADKIVRDLLHGIGIAHSAFAGLLLVSSILDRFQQISDNGDECLRLLEQMFFLAKVLKQLKEDPPLNKEMHDVIEDATRMIGEGSIMCCSNMNSSKFYRFFSTTSIQKRLGQLTQEIDCMHKNISLQLLMRIYNNKAPLSIEYPIDAVGIEESVSQVMGCLECGTEQNALAVILYGHGGMGKTTLANAVFLRVVSKLHFEGWKYSVVHMKSDMKSDLDVIELQKLILKHLSESERIPEITMCENGQGELGRRLEEVKAFILIDNVLKPDELRRLLPKSMIKARKVRLLLTARDENVKYKCPLYMHHKTYAIKDVQPEYAMRYLKNHIKEGLTDDQFSDIVEICCGIPLMLTLVAPFIFQHDDKHEAYNKLMQQKGRFDNGPFHEEELERFLFAFDDIPDICKDPFLDICTFFKGWDWETVADIVGQEKLIQLQQRALITKDLKGVANIHDVILALGKRKSEGTRIKFNSASEMKMFLDKQGEEKSTQGIKGIQLSENKDVSYIKAEKIDTMYKSLRVLALGNLAKFEGKCKCKFEQLVFFQAAGSYLPFDNAKMFKELRYLNYAVQDMNLPKMPSSIRHLELNGRLQYPAFQTYPQDIKQFDELQTLRIINFAELKKLPDLVNGLRELSLSYCESIEELPKLSSKLEQSLRILTMDHCSELRALPEEFPKLKSLRVLIMDHCLSLMELPEDFGSLSSLEELNLQNCRQLDELPKSFEKLSSLKLLDLSSCKNLLHLPDGIEKLTSLVKLHLNRCDNLKSIPDSIGQLKLAASMDMSYCSSLTEIPPGFCKLSSITHLSLEKCSGLNRLPNQFGDLANLIELNLGKCKSLTEVPEGFGQLKHLVKLNLSNCTSLEKLCNDFRDLSSLRFLDLSSCTRLLELPEGFHYLRSLQDLYLCDCYKLQEDWMDNLVHTKTLQLVNIEGSSQLVEKWREIQGEGDQSWSFAMYTGQDLTKEVKEKILQKLLRELDALLIDKDQQQLHVSDCPPGTLIIFHSNPDDDFPWPLIEETINEIPKDFKMIYIGKHYNKLTEAVRGRILGHSPEIFDLGLVVVKLLLTMDADVLKSWLSTLDVAVKRTWLKRYIAEDPIYFQIQIAEEGKGGKFWKVLSNCELEEYVLGNCEKYLSLKETSQKSNVELLKELFTIEEDETIDFLQKTCESNKDPTENIKPFSLRIDKLKGKTILLEMRSAEVYNDILLQSLTDIYQNREKEKLQLEIISVPIVQPNKTFDAFKIAKEVPWLVFQNPWTKKRIVSYFLAKKSGWEGDGMLYSNILWIIKPDGRISICNPYELVKLNLWVPKVDFFRHENFEEWRKNRWNQLKSMSNVEFLFHHLGRVHEDQIISRRNMTCLFSGNKKIIYSIKNALAEHRDRVNIIYIPEFGIKCQEKLRLTDNIYKRYGVLEMVTMSQDKLLKGMCILNRDEAMRFWMHLFYFKKEITAIDESDQETCGMKKLLDSFGGPCMTFMDEDGKIVATCTGEFMKLISREFMKLISNQVKEDIAKRLMQFLINFSIRGKLTDNDYSIPFFAENAQTTDAIDQNTVDVDLKKIREHIALLFKLEKLYKNGSYWPKSLINGFRLKEHWPETPESFLKLRKLFSGDVKVIHDSYAWNQATEIRKYLLEGMKPADYPAACLLVVSNVLDRCLETVFTGREDCLVLLKEFYSLAVTIIHLRRTRRLYFLMENSIRRRVAFLMYGSILYCSQIDPTIFNGIFAKMSTEEMGQQLSDVYREIYLPKAIQVYDSIQN